MNEIKFVTDVFSEPEANVVALRVNCPQSLCEASQMVEPFDITEQKNLLENARIFDAGEVGIDKLEQRMCDVADKGKLPLILGDSHALTLDTVKALKPDKLIVFDAHADLKESYKYEKGAYATWLRQACKFFDAKKIMLLGVRSCDEDEFEFIKNAGIAYFTANNVADNVENVKQRLRDFISDSPVYVSIDMDVFDPSIAPGVVNPEPGGLTYKEFLSLADALKGKRVLGIDCVEIKQIGKNRVTEFLAVKVIFKLLSVSKDYI